MVSAGAADAGLDMPTTKPTMTRMRTRATPRPLGREAPRSRRCREVLPSPTDVREDTTGSTCLSCAAFHDIETLVIALPSNAPPPGLFLGGGGGGAGRRPWWGGRGRKCVVGNGFPRVPRGGGWGRWTPYASVLHGARAINRAIHPGHHRPA